MAINEIADAVAVRNQINGRRGQLVLFQNGPNDKKYNCPGILKAESASIELSKNKKTIFVKISTPGPVYWLSNGTFVRDAKFAQQYHQRGYNFLPGMEGSSIRIGLENVVTTLKDQYHYTGQLPPDLA